MATVSVVLDADGQVRVGEDEAPAADVENRLRQERDKYGGVCQLMLETSVEPDCPSSALVEFLQVCQSTGYCSVVFPGAAVTPDDGENE